MYLNYLDIDFDMNFWMHKVERQNDMRVAHLYSIWDNYNRRHGYGEESIKLFNKF
jgi:hypothetical protein